MNGRCWTRFAPLAAAVALVLVAGAGGCAGDPNSLDGSVRDFYALGFDTVRARLYHSELDIAYVSASGEAVVRVTLSRGPSEPTGGRSFDLATEGDVTGSASGAELPPLVSGTLHLDTYQPREGGQVAGTFEALLMAGSSVITLHGAFDARLTLVEGL